MNIPIKTFRVEEFACRRGCGQAAMRAELLYRLAALRDWIDRPLIVNSGFRCPAHNQRVGGHPRSAHMEGLAVDLRAGTKTLKNSLIEGGIRFDFRGVGVANTFIHLDVKPRLTRAFWRY